MTRLALTGALALALAGANGAAAQTRQVQPAVQRPDNSAAIAQRPPRDNGETVPVAQESSGILIDIYNRVLRACSTVSHIERTVQIRCADGSSLEYTQRCTRTGAGGLWPECNYSESCEAVDVPSCPPVETSPED
ncbi:hypothetical protein [Maricaulis sp.]|uniref:hypothetical protein n=1 Tax=Maricaulis sp. TaxID=1486257 RepID=UPI003A90DE7E